MENNRLANGGQAARPPRSEPDSRMARRLTSSERGGLVAALQNGVVQIRRMRFPGVKGNNYAFASGIDCHVAYSRNFHERLSQFANAFVAIFAFGRDCNSFEHRLVGVLQVMWVGRIEMMRIKRLNHRLSYAQQISAQHSVHYRHACFLHATGLAIGT